MKKINYMLVSLATLTLLIGCTSYHTKIKKDSSSFVNVATIATVVNQYNGHKSHKALAFATDKYGNYTGGYVYHQKNIDIAKQRAIQMCNKAKEKAKYRYSTKKHNTTFNAICKLYAVDDTKL